MVGSIRRTDGSVEIDNFWLTLSGCGEALASLHTPGEANASVDTTSVAAGVEVRQAAIQPPGSVQNLSDAHQGIWCIFAVSLPSDKLSGDGVENSGVVHGIRSGANLGGLLVVTVANKRPHCGPMFRIVSGNRPSSSSGGRDAQAVSTDAPRDAGAAPATNSLAFRFCNPQEPQQREQKHEQASGGGGRDHRIRGESSGGGSLSCTTLQQRAANRDHPAQT